MTSSDVSLKRQLQICSRAHQLDELTMEWLTPWRATTDSEEMSPELIREIAIGHPLFGVPTKTIGRRDDCDDVLFQVEDGSGRVAVVHLTWSMQSETFPDCPHTIFYESLKAWADEGMRLDCSSAGSQ